MATTDDADLWQPWTPQLAQRVRVRRSAECRSNHHILDGSDDGRVGTVAVADRPLVTDHAYFVWYDRPVPTGIIFPPAITGQYYAASELEPDRGRTGPILGQKIARPQEHIVLREPVFLTQRGGELTQKCCVRALMFIVRPARKRRWTEARRSVGLHDTALAADDAFQQFLQFRVAIRC
jgi:hypothetical protein